DQHDLWADWWGARGRAPLGYAAPPRASSAADRPWGRRAGAPALGDEDISAPPDDADEESSLRVGMRVFHEQFGYGEIERVEGAGGKQKVSVRFPGWGLKKIMTQYARLQRVAR